MRFSRLTGIFAALAGAVLASAGVPALVHLRWLLTGASATPRMMAGLAVAAFALLWLGIYMLLPARSSRAALSLLAGLVMTVACGAMGLVLMVLVAVLLSLFGVHGYNEF